jgi:uncharacterized protein Yka (UPF0111/DUF47 family)
MSHDSTYKQLADLAQKMSQTVDRFDELHQEFRNHQIEVYKTGCSIHKVGHQLREGLENSKLQKHLNEERVLHVKSSQT